MRGYLPAITSKWVLAEVVVLSAVGLLAPPALGQNDALNELYGSGVHAFNSGNFRAAYNDLTMAVRSGSRDPRVYYFRGLAYLRLGRPQEARADFNKAAALEMSDSDRFYPVSKSLERIQGSARLQIERARAAARLVAYRTRERGWYERYQRIRKNEPNVLAAPDEAGRLPAPGKPTPAPGKEPAEDEPAEEMPAEDTPAKKPADDNPFGDDAGGKQPAKEMPAEKPADDDPFGDDAGGTEPAKEMPAEKPADDDPFGDDANEKEPAEEMPAEKEDADDEKAADEMPAEKEDEDKDAAADDAEEMKDEAADEAPADEKKPANEEKPKDDDPFAS